MPPASPAQPLPPPPIPPLPPPPAPPAAVAPKIPTKTIDDYKADFSKSLDQLKTKRGVDNSEGKSQPFHPTQNESQKWSLFTPKEVATLPGASVPFGDVVKRTLGGVKATRAYDDLDVKQKKEISKIVSEADAGFEKWRQDRLKTFGLTADRLKHKPKELESSIYERMKHPQDVAKAYDKVLLEVLKVKKRNLSELHEQIKGFKGFKKQEISPAIKEVVESLIDKIEKGEIQIQPPPSTPQPDTPHIVQKKIQAPIYTGSTATIESRGIMSEAGPSSAPIVMPSNYQTPEDKWAAIQKRLYPSARRSETGMTKMDDDDEEDEDGARIIKRSWDEKPKPTRIVGRVEPSEETKALYERMRGKGKSSKK